MSNSDDDDCVFEGVNREILVKVGHWLPSDNSGSEASDEEGNTLLTLPDLFTLRKLRKKPTNFGANYANTKMEPKYETLRLKTTEIKTPVSSKEVSVFDRSQ